MKSYSKLDEIVISNASNTITEGTLVLEGGAFRGVYTSGVLDCLMDNDINLNKCVGISAGALNGANYMAGNRGRTAYINLKYRNDPDYVGVKPLITEDSVVSFDFMLNKCDEELPLNKERLFSKEREVFVGVTSITSGEVKYFSSHDKGMFFDAVQASASMPIVSKPIEIYDDFYLDGGCHTKLPIRFVLDNNMPKPIVILTRQYGYRRKEESSEYKIEKHIYKNHPQFLHALESANKKYNEDSELIETLAKVKKLYLITPSEDVHVSRLESDMEKLGHLYDLGYNDCKNQINKIKKYLGIE